VVVGASCLQVLGAVLCRCCSFDRGASVPDLRGGVRQVSPSASVRTLRGRSLEIVEGCGQ